MASAVWGKGRLAACILLVVILAGCTQDIAAPAASAPQGTSPARPTVVALIDSGINPYHVAFQSRDAGIERHLGFVPEATLVRLAAEGTYDERKVADHDFWTNIEAERLYAFEGTRVLGISMLKDADTRLQDDEFQHGTAVASLVAREDTTAIIVMIQVGVGYCFQEGRVDCFSDESAARAMQWAAEQPWIDVISVSLGAHANPPALERHFPEEKAFFAAAKLAHGRGKIVLNSAGNSGTPTFAYDQTGPPWVITVGGAEAAPKGDGVESSKMVDVAANYTERVADARTVDGMTWKTGTSFSVPIVAGVLSAGLRQVRDQLAHREGILPDGVMAAGEFDRVGHVEVRGGDLRDALNASAVPFSATEWDPSRRPSNETGVYILNNIPVLMPGPQMGWGYVDGNATSAIASWVLSSDRASPSSKMTVAAYQKEWQSLREAYWAGALGP